MAYVQPNSTLQLFKGINLDNRYLHTIYFADEASQNTYFTGKVTSGLTFNNLTYRRYTSTSVKIQTDATKLLGVTYMRFKNDRTVDKWFYAFVLNVDYINENTAVVYYEIDVMQTWFFQGGSIRPCMVLREHTTTDVFGENLEEEPIGSDVYDCDELSYDSGQTSLFGYYALVINTSEKPSEKGTPIINNNLVNGTARVQLRRSDHPNNWETAVNAYIDSLVDTMNGSWEDGRRPVEVIDMFTFPEAFAHTHVSDNTHEITVTHPMNFKGYIPHNKKLFAYPFSFLQITTKDGDGASIKWEYFAGMLEDNTDTATFVCYGNSLGGGQVICYPKDYNGIVDNVDSGVTISNFPKNPFSYDAYQAWVASGGSNKLAYAEKLTNIRGAMAEASSAFNFINDTVGGGAQMFQGMNAITAEGASPNAIAGGIANTVSGANRIIQSGLSTYGTVLDVQEAKAKINYAWKDARYKPNIVVGKATPNLAVAKGYLDFYFQNVHVRVDEMKRLDDFLSCFGYAINKVKQPNLTGRKYFNFVQTQNAVIAGDMPSSSKEAIGRIFDGGITLWKNGDNVGNYGHYNADGTIDNAIPSTP